MDFEKIKIKDIKCISFSLDKLEYLKGTKESFVFKEAKIKSVFKEKGKLKVMATDDANNKAIFKITAKSNQGRNAIDLFVMSRKVIGTLLRDFPNLEFGYFKK